MQCSTLYYDSEGQNGWKIYVAAIAIYEPHVENLISFGRFGYFTYEAQENSNEVMKTVLLLKLLRTNIAYMKTLKDFRRNS